MTWFEKHINWTWLFSVILMFGTVFFSTPIPYVISWILFIVATIWALKQKHRSYWWILIPIAVIFLKNKGTRNPDPDYPGS
jgi:hypothetical protein